VGLLYLFTVPVNAGGRREKISWTDYVRNEELLLQGAEEYPT
jgi:hypothetical protein